MTCPCFACKVRSGEKALEDLPVPERGVTDKTREYALKIGWFSYLKEKSA